MKKQKMCENCEEQPAEYELAGSKCCEDCWFEYWQDNEIGIHTSFEDFKQFSLKKIGGNK